MTFDIEGGDMEQVRVVAKQAKPVVATLTKQSADLPTGVVVVEVLRLRLSADGTVIALRRP
jgi:hypothetical protein